LDIDHLSNQAGQHRLPSSDGADQKHHGKIVAQIESGNFLLAAEVFEEDIGISLYENLCTSMVKRFVQRRPCAIDLMDYTGSRVVHEAGYSAVDFDGQTIRCSGTVTSEAGSVFRFEDLYSVQDHEASFRFSRKVTVEKPGNGDLGFGSRISINLLDSNDIYDFNFFAPGAWYKQNRGVVAHAQGSDLSQEYFWFRETRYALPLFMVQHIASGRTITICHIEPKVDSGVCEHTITSLVSDTLQYGSLGMHKPGGLSLDFLYPGTEGEENQIQKNRKWKPFLKPLVGRSHPVRENLSHEYTLCIKLDTKEDFYAAMTSTWRYFFQLFSPKIVECDNRAVYQAGIDLLDLFCKEYYGTIGVPFMLQLPNGEPEFIQYQLGFVGQQAGIGYQLMRYGLNSRNSGILEKGRAMIDFWVDNSLAPLGLPRTWYDPKSHEFFDSEPIYIRMVADGLEGILDAYRLMKRHGEEVPRWLDFCRKTGDWFVENQNEDGSFFRAYDFDGVVVHDGLYNTAHPIRFLISLYHLTGEDRYLDAALKAGEFSYEHIYKDFMYIGGTADFQYTIDKEAGIYAMFGFTALYDSTGNGKWLEAAVAAANYTETWTYSWEFPIHPIEPTNAYNKVGITGQSLICTGHSGADVYMAACPLAYYRLYLHTGDAHFLAFAKFIMNNTKQTTNWKGNLDYKYRGLVEEGGDLSMFVYRGVNGWLPWCTFVQIAPISKFEDMFGSVDIDEIEKMDLADRRQRNKAYLSADSKATICQ
jgi:hypothetical protein